MMLAGLAMAGCNRTQAPTPTRAVHADSIVLERSPCFGFCPVYRLSLRANGTMRYESHTRGDSTVASDSLAPSAVAWLGGEAERVGFFALPPVIAQDSTLCSARATDHPTATVTIFHADAARQVVDYHGCYTGRNLSVAPAVARLRHFEEQIDSVARTDRWTRRVLPR
jgi:hypothetical protein